MSLVETMNMVCSTDVIPCRHIPVADVKNESICLKLLITWVLRKAQLFGWKPRWCHAVLNGLKFSFGVKKSGGSA